MPDSIRVEICNFGGCQTFDLRLSGHHLQAIETEMITGIHGQKTVYVLEPKDEAEELSFTIRKVRGDVNIQLPKDWTVWTTATPPDNTDYVDFPSARSFARVTAEQGGRAFEIGFVEMPELTINFRKLSKSVGF